MAPAAPTRRSALAGVQVGRIANPTYTLVHQVVDLRVGGIDLPALQGIRQDHVRILRVSCPVCRVVADVPADGMHFAIAANDVVVVPPLPDRRVTGITQLVHPPGTRRFEGAHYRRQGTGDRSAERRGICRGTARRAPDSAFARKHHDPVEMVGHYDEPV